MFSFVVCKPIGQPFMVFKVIPTIWMLIYLLSRLIPQHLFSYCQCFCQTIDVVVFHFFLFNDFKLAMEFFSILDVFLELLFLLFFCLSYLLSSFLHLSFWLGNHIGIVIWIFPLHFFIRVDFTIIFRSLWIWKVDIFIVHFSEGVLKLEILELNLFFFFFQFFSFLILIFIFLRSKSSRIQFILDVFNSLFPPLLFPSFHFECMFLLFPLSLLSNLIHLL